MKDTVNGVFLRAEKRGAIRRVPNFWTDYDEDYPELRRLEAGYEDVRGECLHLLRAKNRITDISVLGGDYTEGGVHVIRWKSFVFKSGRFLEERKGVIFDDFHLHDAANDSNEIRVILWLDIRRKMPVHLRLFNFAVMSIAHRLPTIAKIHDNAQITTS